MQREYRRNWDWPTAFLFALTLLAFSIRLAGTRWVPSLERVQLLVLIGIVLGLALGYSHFRLKGTSWLIAGYTFFLIPWQLAGSIESQETLLTRLSIVGSRLAYSFSALLKGEAIQDPLLFLTLMAFLFWGITIFSGAQIIRHRSNLAILLPATIPLLIIQYYDGANEQRIWITAFYFFCALLLMGRLNFLDNEAKMRKQNTRVDADAHLDIGYLISTCVFVLITLAWFLPLPVTAIPSATHWWNEVVESFETTQETMNDAFAAIQSGGKRSPNRFGSVLGLGTNAATGDEIVFIATPEIENLPRYYWRARVYDTYQDGYWTTRQSRELELIPEQPDLSIPDSEQRDLTQTLIEWQGKPTSLLISLPQPVWSSRMGSLIYSPATADLLDVLAYISETEVQPGDRYNTRALVSNPTINTLRNTGTEYPTWVRQRYLQTPANLSPQIIALAQQITAGQDSPYDKATAITRYLRSEITYGESITAPPPGVDSLEWFLFTIKEGYCNYYATAEVMMLRAVGVPARLAVGYAQGQRASNGTYTTRTRDAHAWPEVYFPEVGWVEFEPTGNQPELNRPSFLGGSGFPNTPNSQSSAEFNQNEEQPALNQENINVDAPYTFANLSIQGLMVWFIIIVVTLIFLQQIWLVHRKQSLTIRIPRMVENIYKKAGWQTPNWLNQWLAWSILTNAEKSFQVINESLNWLGIHQPQHATPAERSTVLIKAIPSAESEIQFLLNNLHTTLFTPQPALSRNTLKISWGLRYKTLQRIIAKWLNGV